MPRFSVMFSALHLFLASGLLAPATLSQQPSSQPASFSSSLAAAEILPLPEAPSTRSHRSDANTNARITRLPMRPFSAFAAGLTFGSGGVGLQVATPLSEHFNLRAGASFFNYNGSFNDSGLLINGQLKFRAVTAALDWFPFVSSFHISPGILLYNGNSFNANYTVPGGQRFDLGDGTYTSDPNNPVNGSGSVSFGSRVAPTITAGFGNMIPRTGGHLSFPVEFGVEYIGPPKINFNLQGSACNSDGCGDIQSDPSYKPNLQQELDDINSDIHPLRFYPIVTAGVAYRF
jgi:hypothetical protein